MKKFLVFALCALMAFSIVSCAAHDASSSTGGSSAADGSAEGSISNVQIPDPFTECETLEAAQETAGFDAALPEAIEGSTGRVFRAMKDSLLEVIYQTGETETARVRKAPGADDISGDYNVYAQTDTVTVGELSVTMKGDGNAVLLATWTQGEYAYALSVPGGISGESMAGLVAQIQ